ncbi:glycoside hydrolase family 28 protein [Paenibacillus aceris]|uniref:Polygalacturonase n=1 Tax=Paenibacillus aceris TaxID=869555 RepID=A0ABS4I3I0_9BACL|nr:glycoside hydrolase family 28 protein [Paenibacillus aceris]MBP1965455.1 polygalacturonase [Paenibacillus aceris]NHW33495.1 glycoside hydrolase family 28 protein [Paenibacillus aceris]
MTRSHEELSVAQSGWTMPEVLLPEIPDRLFRITDFGAVGDGRTDNTQSFQSAIRACSEAGGGRVVIPAGLWLTGPLKLASRLELHTEAGAVVLFTKAFDEYPLVLSSFEGIPSVRCQSPLDAEGLEHIAITGEGIFDGNGEAWRPVKRWKMTAKQWASLLQSGGVTDAEGEFWWPSVAAMNGREMTEKLIQAGNHNPAAYEAYREYLRPNLLSFRRCKHILLDGPTFQNSAAWCLHPWASEHVTIRNTTVRNPWFAQNGDGLDLDSCRYAMIENCRFDVGDDAICMKSGKDEAGRALGIPCEYITIRNCIVYHGHGGFVIGSEMSGGVRRVRVSDCTFIGTDIGLRFKSARGRGGLVEEIDIRRIRMTNIVGEAISFHLFYAGVEGSGSAQEEAFPVSEGTPVFRDIAIEDVTCTGAQTALVVNGLPEMPLENVRIRNFQAVSHRGVIVHYANKLVLERLHLQTNEGPVIKLHQCKDVELKKLGNPGSATGESMLIVTGADSDNIRYDEKEGMAV